MTSESAGLRAGQDIVVGYSASTAPQLLPSCVTASTGCSAIAAASTGMGSWHSVSSNRNVRRIDSKANLLIRKGFGYAFAFPRSGHWCFAALGSLWRRR